MNLLEMRQRLSFFVAGISKNGNLTIRTRFIGHDLTLNDRELKMIEAAKEAKPTDMKTKDTSVADKLREDLGEDENDDLPFQVLEEVSVRGHYI